MRVLVLRRFGELAVESRPDPTPGPGQVLVAVVATGICGSDLHGFTGANGRRVPGQVMGHESVGRVAALGPEVTVDLAVGRPVTFNPVVLPDDQVDRWRGREHLCPDKYVIGVKPDVVAAFAELIAVPARNVVPLPEDLPLEQGALIEPLAVGVHAVGRVADARPRTALVVGGGPIGQSVVLALRMAGVEQIAVSEPDPGRRELCAQLGAVALDPGVGPVADQAAGAFGGPMDVALDAVGVSASVADALAATRVGGAVCLVGMGSPRIELEAYAVSTAERSLVGSFTYSAADFARAAAALAGLPAAALISRQVPLDEAPQAFVDLARPDGTPGKVLVRLDR